MTYIAETKSDTSKTFLETAEMRILRRLTGNTKRSNKKH